MNVNHPYTKLKYIFNKLNVKNSKDIALKMISGNIEKYVNLFNKSNTIPSILIGGDRAEKVPFTYKNTIFYFHKIRDENFIFFNIYKDDNPDELPQCLIIMIDREEKICEIIGISYNDRCFNKAQIDSFNGDVNGSLLLKVGLKFIDFIKDHYKLKYVKIKDNGFKHCEETNKFIQLSSLSMLCTGETWYVHLKIM